jgi:hypothetical protein
MKLDLRVRIAALLLPLLTLTGCELVGDLLEIGFWAGAIIVVVIVGVIWWIVRMIGGRREP